MKLTKRQLKRLIQEELRAVLNESLQPHEGWLKCMDWTCLQEAVVTAAQGGDPSSLPCVEAAMSCIQGSPEY